MGENGLRGRALLDRWFPVVVAAALVLAGVGVWVTHGAHVAPGTTTEQRTVEEWAVSGSFDHRATVRPPADGRAFEPGTTVTNRTIYFQRVMPVLSGAFVLGYEGTTPAEVEVERQVRVRSVGGDEGETVYWSRTLATESRTATLDPTGTVRVPFSLDVAETTLDARNVSERLRAPGRVQIDVVVDATVERRGEGATVRDLSFTLPVRPEGSVYRVEADPREETFERTETVTVAAEPGPLRSLGGPAAGVAGLAALGGLLLARSRGLVALSEAERAWLDYRDDRADFEEWITTIRLPPEARDLPVAEAATLADLVDFAIDVDSAVLESPDEERYHVVHDGYRYTFDAPPVPERSLADGADREAARTATSGRGDGPEPEN
jgi:hypothetical protein